MRKRPTSTVAGNAQKSQQHAATLVQEAWSTWATTESAMRTRQMRHLWCDCVIKLRMDGDTNTDDSGNSSANDDIDDISKTITAHRVVLARWPYFARLFALTDPDGSEAYEGENGRTHYRHVYNVTLPFESSSVHTLVDMLYDPRRLPSAIHDGDCDAADLVDCALFLNADRELLLRIMEIVLDALLPPKVDDEAATAPNAAVGAFLLRALGSGLDDEIKRGLVSRLAYLLSDDDRTTLADVFGSYYDPTRCLLLEPVAPGGIRLCCGLRDQRRKVVFVTPEWGKVTMRVTCAPSPGDPTIGDVAIKIDSDLPRWHITVCIFKPFSDAVIAVSASSSPVDNPPTASDDDSRRPLSPFTLWQIDLLPEEQTDGA